jgi:hypothetical protein
MPEKTTGSLGSLILLRKADDEGAPSTDRSSSGLVTANPRRCIKAPLHLAFIAFAWLKTEARIGERMIVLKSTEATATKVFACRRAKNKPAPC